eukprot:symbB.v1.2.029794.t1/scaffold3289.1/size59672/3
MVGLTFFGSCFLSFWGFVNADSIIVQEGSDTSDYPSGVVLASGLPIVAGTTYGSFPGITHSGSWAALVVKYNTDGTQAAIKTYATSNGEQIYASAIDNSNNVYVTGYTGGDLAGDNQGGNDVFLAKLDSSLTQVWLIQTGTTSSDFGYAVAVDSASRVIIGGYTAGALTDETNLGSNDCFIMQYSSTGSREWVIQFGSTDSDYLYGLAVDTVGSVDDIYGTGYSSGTFENQSNSGWEDMFLIKVNSTGAKIWTVLVGSSSSEYGYAVVVDSARNAYVSGYTSGALPGATSLGSNDGFLMKYDKDGVQQWLIQFGGTSGDYAYGLQIDSNDMLYPVLWTEGSMEGTNLGSHDMVVMQVDSTGSVYWTEQFGTSDSDFIKSGWGSPVAIDSTGDLFIAGITAGAFTGYSNQGNYDWFLYKVEAKSTTTSSSSSTSSSTSTSITATSTTSSSTTSYTITLSTTSTSSSSSTGTVTSTSTSSSTTTTTSTTSATSSTSRTSSSSSTSSQTTTTRSTTTSTSTSSITSSSSSTSTSSTTSNSSSTSTSSTTSSTSSGSSTSTSSTTSSSSSTSTSSTTSSTTSTLSSTSTSTSTASSTSTTITQTSRTSTVTTTATTSTSSSTSSFATKTSSSTWTNTVTRTTITTTKGVPQEISPAELEAMEAQRKEEAKQAVAAVEAAETAAVLEAFSQIFSSGNRSDTPPGVLGEALMKTDAGPVKVAALSVEALAAAGEAAKISAGEDSSAEVEVDAGLLGEVAASAGGEMVLLSLAELRGKAAGSLQSDNVLAESGARRLASALRSQPLSINFRRTDGSKIDVKNLQQPMKMVLQVDDPNATCAFWDEHLAKWSSEGVETLPSEGPGTLVCRTRHLSIFGGVISVVLKNVVVALECSTFSTLMDAAAFEKLGQPDWLQQPPGAVSICILVFSTLGVCLAGRADKKALLQIPWAATESMLMREKETRKAKDEDEEVDVEEVDGAEDEKDEEDEQATQKAKDSKKGKSEAKDKKDSAAGGDWELPSIFRTLRGLVESLLDTLSQATGGENFVDEIKELRYPEAKSAFILSSVCGFLSAHL